MNLESEKDASPLSEEVAHAAEELTDARVAAQIVRLNKLRNGPLRTIEQIRDLFTRLNRIEKSDPESLNNKLDLARELEVVVKAYIQETEEEIVGELAKILNTSRDKIDINKIRELVG